MYINLGLFFRADDHLTLAITLARRSISIPGLHQIKSLEKKMMANAQSTRFAKCPGDLPDLELIARQPRPVPMEETAALEGGFHGIILC